MDLRKKELCCISHAFTRSAKQNPTRTAMIHFSPSSYSLPLSFTYAQLISAVGYLSNRIRLILQPQCDKETETNRRMPRVIGIHLSSVEYVIAVLSVLNCGEAFLPLDPLWPDERILRIVNSSNVSLVIANRSSCIADVAERRVLCVDLKDFAKEKIDWNCDNDKDWACGINRKYSYVIYTSGSSGKPKGVCGTEAGLLNRFEWMQEKFPLRKEDFVLFKTSISFVDHLQEFLSPLLIGSTLVIQPSNELKADPSRLVNFIKEFNISRLTAVPSLVKIILPFLENLFLRNNIFNPLKILILSGEIFSIELWKELNRILPETTILNLYGSTEVSGDCTYFNCKDLPNLLQSEELNSVPIGVPISNCEVILSNEGEIQVCGTCLFTQYLNEPVNNNNIFKTGDFARRLKTGELQFLGRKDRVVKINGQRISLQEIENTLMGHPYINNAAVNVIMKNGDISHINAYFVVKNEDLERENDIEVSLRREMIRKLIPVMVPRYFFKLNELPVTFSGKIDYEKLSCLEYKEKDHNNRTDVIIHDSRLDQIKKAFKETLSVHEISENDDFFVLGGNSLLAAQIAYKLNIDMRLIYIYPTPYKLLEELLRNNINLKISSTNNTNEIRKKPKLIHKKTFQNSNDEFSRNIFGVGNWAVSRCNQYLHGSHCKKDIYEIRVTGNEKPDLKEVWKVNLGSCVDASPLIVCLNGKMSLFIGSHSHNFLHIDVLNGSVRWEVKLEGREECSAAITSDFSQVVVGCYKGNIYFIEFNSGNISWKFETKGEIKMQPVLDEKRDLVWCGSYDHFLYALNYKENTCFYKISCGGSIYSSPCIDKLNEILYVVSTSGLLSAINLEGSTFEIKWQYELGAPAFGSLAIDIQTGNVICCLVNGDAIALNAKQDIIWKVNVGGPIFAGACLSSVIPYQVLVCSRNGSLYTFDTRDGALIWEYLIGDPITASAFVDQQIVLNSSERLLCICSSSGQVHILGIKSDYVNQTNGENKNKKENKMVREVCKTNLAGDIFSSPVMINGRIFLGCRDDFVHCLDLEL